ncbi:MAG: phytoene desaturase family protein [Xanthobacteraceae bacterium]
MTQSNRKIVIIGAGIAGLCAAVYARKCGYQVEVLEMHETAGGLATSWHRDGYTFETCLHALPGSSPDNRTARALWREVCEIDKLTFVVPDEFIRVEDENGERLSIYTNLDRLESELLAKAPKDEAEIRHLVAAARKLAGFEMPDPNAGLVGGWLAFLRTLPYLPLLRKWSSLNSEDYAKRLVQKQLRSLFEEGSLGHLFPALNLVIALAALSRNDAGYPIGGSQALIRLIVKKLQGLDADLRCGARVEKILIERDAAVGVQIVGGKTARADWVISAADGHSTIYDLLDGKYRDEVTDKIYRDMETFPSYLQVSLGVARDLSQQAGYLTRLLDVPLQVDPNTRLQQVSFRIFHFDSTFAPPGKTAVTCFLPTRNFAFWTHLQKQDHAQYQAEKQRVAEAVVAVLEKIVPDVRQAIEVTDVSSPASVIRYTGNWKGSMEGWLQTPGTGFRPLRNTLPGLQRFFMAGQWVMPGGGLLPGLMSARSAVTAVCRQDRTPFTARV